MEYPKEIITAIHQVMSKVGYVQKKDRNEFHKYKYAGESALLEVLRPAMLEAGLLLIPSGKSHSEIDQYGNTHIEMEYTLAHTSGAVWPEKLVAFGCGGDKNSKGGVGDKGTYKAITGAGKYMLFKLFLIETGDDPENDGEKQTKGKSKQAPKDTSKAGVDDIPLNKPHNLISEAQRKRMFAISKQHEWAPTAVKSLLAKHGFESSNDVTWEKYSTIIDELEHGMEGND